ncbi:hypothetical protein Glove_55g71 [Diversispora epigaea]|uniref:Uncharacterized protein n=1 Tax=Diversispora epigaea TaxID=1348612 RepID=A0A397JEQ7_9GLOM|nr:hypothetical protein Glove_55g71 [Diversispora epigaea]
MDSRHHSKLFKRIKAKLLEKLQEMRGGIASRVKSAIFEIFGRGVDAEETLEEESEEEEEEGKSLKRRKTLRGHVPSPGRAPSPGRVSPPLTSPSRLLPEYFNTEGEGRQRAREVLQRSPEGRRESRRQHSQEGWRESRQREGRQRSGEEEGDTTDGDTERAEIVGEQ